MIIYSSDKKGFIDDFENGVLVQKIYDLLAKNLRHTGKNEIASWQNSLSYMCNVIRDQAIPEDVGVAIEFVVPNTNKRVDFIFTGLDKEGKGHAIVVELKQWSEAKLINFKDAIVSTYVGGGLREVAHPSYQAWSYCSLIENFNSSAQDRQIKLHPCSYLHNYNEKDPEDLRNHVYADILSKSPLFTQGQMNDLRNYVKSYIKKGDSMDIMEAIESGKLRPSKSLQDNIASMLQGNTEFVMIDEQKVEYETILYAIKEGINANRKTVYIVKGGPGTGKSVIAINLLANLINNGVMAQYITKNAAPRAVYKAMLKGKKKAADIDNLFKGSASFKDIDESSLQVAIVDEAHRLSTTPDQYRTSLNQVHEIIDATLCSIFFIDEHQRVTTNDGGTIDLIRKYAEQKGAYIYEGALESQFRCNGADGYLAWIDNLLEIRETANYDGFEGEYDFRVFDDPAEMQAAIIEKNTVNNKSRIVAGYCWEWPKEGRFDSSFKDIQIEGFNFGMSWNLGSTSTFAIDKDSVHEAGCIHTTQGLEFDYVGVIIGDDMRYEDGHVVTDLFKRAKSDQSLKGLKGLAKKGSPKAIKEADEIIRNTYRTLMTRGMKGCYVFCTDKALANYLKSCLSNQIVNFIKE